jgi:Xaa-Pro aminopeptidase
VNDAENTLNSASQPLEERVNNRSQRPSSDAFKAFMASNWAPTGQQLPARDAVADYAAARRKAISDQVKVVLLLIPAGPLKVRSNDGD